MSTGTNDVREIARSAMKDALGKGAKEAAAIVSRTRNVTVEWRDGKVEKINEATTRRLTLQLYVAVIGTLLLHIATGRRVSKYSLFWVDCVLRGQASVAEMEAGLARRERERELERARLARKKAAAKQPA